VPTIESTNVKRLNATFAGCRASYRVTAEEEKKMITNEEMASELAPIAMDALLARDPRELMQSVVSRVACQGDVVVPINSPEDRAYQIVAACLDIINAEQRLARLR
jgi:hypothetical protein